MGSARRRLLEINNNFLNRIGKKFLLPEAWKIAEFIFNFFHYAVVVFFFFLLGLVMKFEFISFTCLVQKLRISLSLGR